MTIICEKCTINIEHMTDKQQQIFLTNKNDTEGCGLANRVEVEICVPLLRLIVDKKIIQ